MKKKTIKKLDLRKSTLSNMQRLKGGAPEFTYARYCYTELDTCTYSANYSDCGCTNTCACPPATQTCYCTVSCVSCDTCQCDTYGAGCDSMYIFGGGCVTY
jgi:hypothetical protein